MAADPDLDVPAEEPREPPQPQVPPQPEPDPAEEEKRRREAEFALLNKEIDRVERKCRDYEATAMGTIDEAIATLELYKNKVMECDEDDEEALENVVKEFEKVWSEANYPSRVAPEAKPAKDMLACVGKLGKAIEKVCPKEKSWENATWDLKEHPIDRDALKEVIVNHLYRVGRFDIGDLYAESEGGELADVDPNAPKPIPPERREAMKAPFVEMWNVTWQIEREGDLSGLKTWLERNGDALVNKYTGAPPRVEFLLRKLEYVRMLTGHHRGSSGEEPDGKRARTEGNGAGVGDGGDVDGAAAAVAYGKEHFEKFTRLRDSKEANEVRRLMAAAVYARVGLENSPYKDIERECREIGGVLNPYTFDPDLRKRMEETAKGTEEDLADFEEIGSAWWELVNEFQSSHCILAGQPGEPPLLTIYNVGVIAMPTLVKAAQVARARGQDWNKVECIPADIDLPDKYMFRSIFVCPVSKEEATPENPPMMLTCGHALCRETTKTLAKPDGSFKCPYCPAVSTVDGCLELHL